MPDQPCLILNWRVANGRVYGTFTRHPRLTGEWFVDYPIARDGDTLITPHGDRFELGNPSADTEATMPNARVRVIASVNEVAVDRVPPKPGQFESASERDVKGVL